MLHRRRWATSAELVEMASQLQWIQVTLCVGPPTAFLRQEYDEWTRELEATGAEVEHSDESESCGATLQDVEAHLLGQHLRGQFSQLRG